MRSCMLCDSTRLLSGPGRDARRSSPVRLAGPHSSTPEAKLLEVDGGSLGHRRNPTRRVSFRFIADSYAKAELLATDELPGSAIRAGVEALDPSLRHIGWMVSIGVAPA